MNILMLLIPLALLMAVAFAAAFLWAAERGQYDDLETPAHRILIEEPPERKDP